ncbi:MAG TPA: TolC family protein [Caulobacteraceae bacterium]|nr:TolC family protein [Caulobacteraceae bacterium]
MKSGRAALLLLAGAAALQGCASGVRKADLTLPTAYEAPAGAAQLTSLQLDRWWTIFGDDQLNVLEEQALKNSPDAKTQIARLQEAAATRNSDILQTFPTGDLTGGATKTTTSAIDAPKHDLFPVGGVTRNDHLDFKVSWELDFFGALRDARQAARADFAAIQFNVESARASLVANVADSYFQARGLAIQLDDATETLRIENQLLRSTTIKAERGLGPQSDADRIAGDAAQAKSQVENLKAQQHAAQRLLLILVGRGPEPVENLPLAASVPDPPPLPEAMPGALLVRRPDVREAEMRLRSATLRTKLQKEELFPNLTLQPALGLARNVAPGVGVIQNAAGLIFFPQTQTTSTDYWAIGVNVDQPVLDIPRLLQDVKAQSARAEQAVIAYEKAVQTAYGDAENALIALSADEVRIKILTDGEARARRAYDAARTRFAAGVDDITAVLSAEQTWRTDRTELTAERVQALRRAVQTYKALGGGWNYETTTTAARSP